MIQVAEAFAWVSRAIACRERFVAQLPLTAGWAVDDDDLTRLARLARQRRISAIVIEDRTRTLEYRARRPANVAHAILSEVACSPS